MRGAGAGVRGGCGSTYACGVNQSHEHESLVLRVQKLEESLGFADHRVDQLQEALEDIGARLDRALKRLDVLEARARKEQEGTPGEEGGGVGEAEGDAERE